MALYGGGIYNSGTATLNKVMFRSNVSNAGGGIFNYPGTLTLTNVTISGNSAVTGGGMFNGGISSYRGNASLTNVTLSGNSATYGGGIYSDGSATLKNTIVANSSLGGNCGGTITSHGHNLEDANTCSFDPGLGDQINTNPKLGLLANNGGFAQTMALWVGSAAIDAGDNNGCPPTDERGVSRPQGAHCDIGAYEAQQQQPVPAEVLEADTILLLGSGLGGLVVWLDWQRRKR